MKSDVLIIGGGIAGCALAYFLAREGVRPTLIERHDLNTMASGSNAGSIHAQMDHAIFEDGKEEDVRRSARLVPMLMASITFWKELERELDEDFELETIGGILVADRPEHMRTIARKVAFEQTLGLSIELLSAADIQRVAPYISESMIGGALCPIEGEANALVVTPALAKAALRHGATLMTGTELLSLAREGSTYVAGTSRGQFEAPVVVNCAGSDGGAVGRLLGVDLPIFGEPIQVNVTEPTAPLIRHLVYYAGGRLTAKQSKRGALIIGGGWPAQIDAAGRLALDPVSFRHNLQICNHVIPRSGSVRVIRTWPALVNDTADALPIIGEVGRMPGYYVASFPRMGFTGGPLMAKVVARMILRQPTEVDISAFAPERFL